MKFCTHCGREIADEAVVCPRLRVYSRCGCIGVIDRREEILFALRQGAYARRGS